MKTSTCSDSIADIPPASSIDEFSSIETEYGTAFSDYSCFTKEIITPVELPTGKTVIDVFAACFDDGQPLLEKYHTERGDVDQQWENWRPIPRGKSFCGQRKFVCTTLVKAMMNKPYSFYEYQRYGFLNVNGTPTLLLQFSSQVPGVMFGESFRVEALSVFSQEGEGESAKVTMRAYCYVQFLKSVWVKGKINSTSQSEQSESYKKISQMIKVALSGDGSSSVPPIKQPVSDSFVNENGDEDAVKESNMVQSRCAKLFYVILTWSTMGIVLMSSLAGFFDALFYPTVETDSTESKKIFESVKPMLWCFYTAIILLFCGISVYLLSRE
ncbi:VAD1 Analog of StAR-related lipid transfer domain containing protein, putative [Angomonas deanei]|uniref:VAD1 Analog of StAR-related lipid transfer domain containing protein, putative n=1 Tax=Angomonas deanei TaxID=59799 RepID=A0A7G2CRU5_9TRYP|nr:VAD1 Analog of StAR-related lipid transfer domain containing protein, putative [Angomonas deanei]